MTDNDIRINTQSSLKLHSLEPNEPLWKRVPTHDEFGKPASDFRMVICGLKKRPPLQIQSRVKIIQSVLNKYESIVLFADLNLKTNLLWVSVRSAHLQDMNIAAEIHHLIPEAKVLADMPR